MNANWEETIEYDPGLRKEIDDYHPNQRDRVRRKYLENGPCQPRDHVFPVSVISNKDRRFNATWLDEFGGWLEHNKSKDIAYCFLFRDQNKKEEGYKAFVSVGWIGHHRKDRLREHIGGVGSLHNQAKKNGDALLKRSQRIDVNLQKASDAIKKAYFIRLNGAISVARKLLKLGLPFRGHDESVESCNKGNFLEICDLIAEHDPVFGKVAGKEASGNSFMVSPEIQRDVVECCANEILDQILKEMRHDVFCLLVDESRDLSCKEQMAVVIRYVDNFGVVKEKFVGSVHVKETSSSYLKTSIDALFAKFKLSLSQVRGQGYDRASNMRALQWKDQDIVNAIKCVKATRSLLNDLRIDGWEKLLGDVYGFCDKHDIIKLEMEDAYINPLKPRKKSGITNMHHYHVDCFNTVIDWLLQEIDNLFNETTPKLLVCSTAFSPRDSFQDFNVDNLLRLRKMYQSDFTPAELREISHHLSLYIVDVREDDRFTNLWTIGELSQNMVETRNNLCYSLVYRLLKLVLVLPVAIATIERISLLTIVGATSIDWGKERGGRTTWDSGAWGRGEAWGQRRSIGTATARWCVMGGGVRDFGGRRYLAGMQPLVEASFAGYEGDGIMEVERRCLATMALQRSG